MAALSLGAAALMAGEFTHYRHRAKVGCHIPNYSYVRTEATSPVTSQSTPGLLLPARIPPEVANSGGTPLGQPGAIRFWQMDQLELRQQHCAISQVSFWIDHSQKRWCLSYRATQEPFIGPDRQATPEARFLRNRFHVTVRGVGLATERTTVDTAPLTGPELLRVNATPRWIERSHTELIQDSGQLDEASMARVPYLDRLLIDFRYE